MTESIKSTKGERTAGRILDAAEALFAQKGYEGTSLREVASIAGIKEPGLYRYFGNKDELYQKVLERSLQPLADALDMLLEVKPTPRQVAQLPMAMIDMLAEHPYVAILLQQVLTSGRVQEEGDPVGIWLEQLFAKGRGVMLASGFDDLDDTELALRLVNFFNLCAGFFASQQFIQKISHQETSSEEIIERQKQILSRLVQTWMIM